MKINTRTSSFMLFILGAVLFTLVVSIITLPVSAAGTLPGAGFAALQTAADTYGYAIMGLAIGAGLALGIAGAGAGIGMGTASAAALGAITEKPETFGKSILYVVFIEAIAIYGFVIAFLLVGYIPSLIPTH
ncbi:MAG: ATP synthase subunit C [Candidatus Thorarchaeota archaeon]|nr:ATP synthase subunit C [Candidatus Thorarchaeota archaeon]